MRTMVALGCRCPAQCSAMLTRISLPRGCCATERQAGAAVPACHQPALPAGLALLNRSSTSRSRMSSGRLPAAQVRRQRRLPPATPSHSAQPDRDPAPAKLRRAGRPSRLPPAHGMQSSFRPKSRQAKPLQCFQCKLPRCSRSSALQPRGAGAPGQRPPASAPASTRTDVDEAAAVGCHPAHLGQVLTLQKNTKTAWAQSAASRQAARAWDARVAWAVVSQTLKRTTPAGDGTHAQWLWQRATASPWGDVEMRKP